MTGARDLGGRALLLDLDRTLVDLQSFTDYDAAWEQVRDLLEGAELPSAPQTGWPSGTRACMAAISGIADVELWHRVSSAIEAHERAAITASRPMPDVAEFWKATAELPRGVVTLLPESVAREVLTRHGLLAEGEQGREVVVVGRDPLIRPKPSGDGLRSALGRLAGSAGSVSALMVGDSTWDALAARDAGCDFVGVHAPPGEFDSVDPRPTAVAGLRDVLRVLS